MAQQKRQTKKHHDAMPFGKKNLQILIVGLILILLGYLAMSQPPVDSFLSLTASPIILLFALLVVIPYSIFYGHFSGKKKSKPESDAE
jgi:uncharacterized membrane protein HdeD (DUF308 family)